MLSEKWQFYKKQARNLKFKIALPLRLKIFSQSEVVEMAENAGLKFLKAYDCLHTLAPIRADSSINMVFQKK
ncbi:MAG: hypothetical protein ABIL22_00015 [candidate division WOR-3 bacterium]